MNDWLEPIGNTGFYQSPLEPVDPHDCVRWPSSPFCGEFALGDPDWGTKWAGLGVEFSRNECETCITVNPTLGLFALPPYVICYRSPNCKPVYARLDLPKNDHSRPFRRYCGNSYYGIELAQSLNFDLRNYQVYDPESPVLTVEEGTEIEEVFSQLEEIYETRLEDALRKYKIAFGSTNYVGKNGPYPEVGSTGIWNLIYVTPGEGKRVIDQFINASGWPIRFYTPDRTAEFFIGGETYVHSAGPNVSYQISTHTYKIQSAFFPSCGPNSFNGLPPPPPDQCEPCMSCCCNTPSENEEINRQILKLLQELHKGVGVSEFPASVPANLLADRSNAQISIGSLGGLLGWFIQQFDALVGQWPLEIEIEDTDPTQPGNQSQKVKMPNLAEALAELYGLTVNASVDSDTAINMLTRVLAELVATKNAALITQDYVKANTDFFGYKGNPVERTVQYAVDPTQLETLDRLLQRSEHKIRGWENQEQTTLVETLVKLMFSAGIIKSAFFRTAKTHGETSLRKNLVDLARQYATEGDQSWEKFMNDINNPSSKINAGDYPQPKVKDISINSVEDFKNLLDSL